MSNTDLFSFSSSSGFFSTAPIVCFLLTNSFSIASRLGVWNKTKTLHQYGTNTHVSFLKVLIFFFSPPTQWTDHPYTCVGQTLPTPFWRANTVPFLPSLGDPPPHTHTHLLHLQWHEGLWGCLDFAWRLVVTPQTGGPCGHRHPCHLRHGTLLALRLRWAGAPTERGIKHVAVKVRKMVMTPETIITFLLFFFSLIFLFLLLVFLLLLVFIIIIQQTSFCKRCRDGINT